MPVEQLADPVGVLDRLFRWQFSPFVAGAEDLVVMSGLN